MNYITPSLLMLVCFFNNGKRYPREIRFFTTKDISKDTTWDFRQLTISSDSTFFYSFGGNCYEDLIGKGHWSIKNDTIILKGNDSLSCVPNVSYTSSVSTSSQDLTLIFWDHFGKELTSFWFFADNTIFPGGDNNTNVIQFPKNRYSYFYFTIETLKPGFVPHTIDKNCPDTITFHVDYPANYLYSNPVITSAGIKMYLRK